MNDAAFVAAALAADPGLGGAVLRGPPCEARDALLATLRRLLPFSPWRRMPLHVSEERLAGGLDLTATLLAGRPVCSRGLLAEAAGGVLVVAMAERVSPHVAAQIAAAMDEGGGLRLVLLDEGGEDEAAPPALRDRCAFLLEPETPDPVDSTLVAASRLAAGGVMDAEGTAEAVCATSLALGIDSARAPLLALRAARIAAALDGRCGMDADDIARAARLALAWRATRLPASDQAPYQQTDSEPPESAESEGEGKSSDTLVDRAVESAVAAIPANLLASLRATPAARGKAGGRSASIIRHGTRHGRPAGVCRGKPEGGTRLAVIDTLRAAAPWQRLRRDPGEIRVAISRDDLRVHRTKPRAETVTIFAIDASGSAAMARLAEAKGAVERLLAECYIRRDQVAVLAFRGTRAETLLPPTRSLTRAKRALAQLPGGGGTPLAAGLFAAASLAQSVRRAGRRPRLVVLTDGRANIARDGMPGRKQAEADARDAGRVLAAAHFPCLLIDTAIRPQPELRALASAMQARYFPLPQADSGAIARAVREGA